MCLVCLIDDDSIQHFLVDRLLVKNGLLNRLFYFDASLALKDIQEHLEDPEKIPDIIILDLNMPVMDGWQFLDAYKRLINKIKKPVRIYMLSSSIDPRDIMRSKEYEFVDGFLNKPLTLEQVRNIITCNCQVQVGV